MNRKLRAALLIVAVVSIAIALYYPVTQYLEGKALDDEMLKLRRMKADVVYDVSDSEPLPVQTVQGAFPERTPGDVADHGLETSGAGAEASEQALELEISNGESGKPDGASTDRMAVTGGITEGATNRMTVTGGITEGATDRMAETDGIMEGKTDRTAEPTPAPTPVPEPKPTPFVFDESKILPEYKALYEENRDLVGWMKIDGTMVDYPVLQRADEEYYLTHDFYGSSNSNGQLIMDAQCDPYTPDVNLVISGHDMKSGNMFGTLQRYASERFGRQHPIIEFDTLFRRGRYRLVAAFQTSDYLKREDGFRYNVDIRYRIELKKYLEELEQIKLYDTGVPVEFGDQLITLSTCSTQTDGRFVVVARRLREGEQP